MPVETRDISLAGRIIAQFPDRLTDEQRIGDALAELGALAKPPEANIIKLPNISASIPQLKAAIKELQEQGYDLPDYPESPSTDEERATRATLRQGQGLRGQPGAARGQLRPPRPARRSRTTPARTRTRWGPGRADSKTNVATHGRPTTSAHNEKSAVIATADDLRIELAGDDGSDDGAEGVGPRPRAARSSTPRSCGVAALREFLTAQIERAKADDVLFSLHLKATMMKVSDPIIFGHAVRAFFPDGLRRARRDARGRGPLAQRRARRHPRRASSRCRTATAIKAAVEQGIADGPRAGDGRLRPRHHQPARAVRRDRRRLDAGDDPHLGPHVGSRRPGGRHARRHPRLVATPASTRSSSTTAAPTAPTTRRPWARCPTSG